MNVCIKLYQWKSFKDIRHWKGVFFTCWNMFQGGSLREYNSHFHSICQQDKVVCLSLLSLDSKTLVHTQCIMTDHTIDCMSQYHTHFGPLTHSKNYDLKFDQKGYGKMIMAIIYRAISDTMVLLKKSHHLKTNICTM